jgi:dihydroorotase
VPDTFGTDLHQSSANGPVIDMAHVLGKVLSMGVPLHRAVAGVTTRAAAAIGRPELGVLREGGQADIVVFRVRRGHFGYTDCGLARIAAGSGWRSI